MRRMPSRCRIAPLDQPGCPGRSLRGIRRRFRRLSPCTGQVAYVLLTRAPVAGGDKQACLPDAPRLACVKPVASVHPEPGSNSPLLFILSFSFFKNFAKTNLGRLPESDALAGVNVLDLSKSCLGSELTESFLFAIVLLRLYCNSFNVLFLSPGRRARRRP